MAKRHEHIPIMKNRGGFTIVELLIVVIVIAILAAITIVSYNGISQRATAVSISSDLVSASKRLKLDLVDSPTGTYPATLADANGGKGIQASSGTTFQYTVDNSSTPPTFGLTATNGKTSYYLNQDGVPTAGAFTGHSNGGAAPITNYAPNPSVENDTAGMTGANSSTVARSTAMAHSGSASLQVTVATNGAAGNVGASIFNLGASTVPSVLAANTTYTVSAWVYNSTVNGGLQIVLSGSGWSTRTSPTPFTSTKNSWTRLTSTFTTSTSGTITGYILNANATTAGQIFYLDDVMLTPTSYLTTYADGNSPGWAWNGTQNSSTSFGPAS